MDSDSLPHAALNWTPPGERGRPLGTWRRTVEEEMKIAVETWIELGWLIQNRPSSRRLVGALCSSGSEEDCMSVRLYLSTDEYFLQ